MAEKGPDQLLDRQVNQRETKRLAAMSELATDDFAEPPMRKVRDVLADRGRSFLMGLRRICGRVVKRDPLTGELLAVPGATVEVQFDRRRRALRPEISISSTYGGIRRHRESRRSTRGSRR